MLDSESRLRDRLVVQPDVPKELFSTVRVPDTAEPKIERAPCPVGLVVTTDIMAKEIVCEQQI
jgi:hypothetical protein